MEDNDFTNYSLTEDEYVPTENNEESNSFTSVSSPTSLSSNKSSKKRKKGSYVWEYFNVNLEGKTICNVLDNNGQACSKTYAHGSTTSNLIYHLSRKHGIIDPENDIVSINNIKKHCSIFVILLYYRFLDKER